MGNQAQTQHRASMYTVKNKNNNKTKILKILFQLLLKFNMKHSNNIILQYIEGRYIDDILHLLSGSKASPFCFQLSFKNRQ